jgi:hypothetical protein
MECEEKWHRWLEGEKLSEELEQMCLSSCSTVVTSFFRAELKEKGGKAILLRMVLNLPVEYRQELLPELLRLACDASYVPTIVKCREILQTLPRKWVVERFEAAAVPLIEPAEEWVFRRLLEVAAILDANLLKAVATRASAHADPEIRRIAQEFLDPAGPAGGRGIERF